MVVRSCDFESSVIRTLSVCAPGRIGKTKGTSMMLFETHPSLPHQAAGKVPGVLTACTKYLVCGAPLSIWSARPIGRLSPKVLRDGDTFVVIVTLPFCPCVLNRKKS